MDIQRWLDDGGAASVACCPDPADEYNPELDAIIRHGFDPYMTPVDTLMAGPASMHLRFGDDLSSASDRGRSPDYANH